MGHRTVLPEGIVQLTCLNTGSWDPSVEYESVQSKSKKQGYYMTLHML